MRPYNFRVFSLRKDNRRLIRIPVTVSTDWRVTGTSKPGQVEYNISQEIPDKYYFEDELGEEVFHVYDVKNRGPSTIQEAEVFILWPSFNDNGDHLLYLLNVDYDKSKAKCQSIDNINPLYVKVSKLILGVKIAWSQIRIKMFPCILDHWFSRLRSSSSWCCWSGF